MWLVVSIAVGIVVVIAYFDSMANYPEIYENRSAKDVIGIIAIPVLVGSILIYDKYFKKKRGGKGGIRRGWSEIEKEEVRERQGGSCNKCGKSPPRWEYHHRNGNRSDNSLNNCEGLCPNCHSVKTHG